MKLANCRPAIEFALTQEWAQAQAQNHRQPAVQCKQANKALQRTTLTATNHYNWPTRSAQPTTER